MRVLLDTSVLLGPPPPLDGAEVAISVVSLAELHFGVLVARDADVRGERLRRVGLIEKTFDALPVDDAVAREYGRLAAATVQAGRRTARPIRGTWRNYRGNGTRSRRELFRGPETRMTSAAGRPVEVRALG